ncbi:DUF3558 family protein [Nocardia terpenica]|uniref:Uncharacterized protein n=1 Tax=Nocardia terpenica TaxID=455432 RepID=A0A161WPB3_9NOCA|nr:DUF3558 family protein [Nocardia terpenica]KZM74985.1 hypothetical protein AWN90_23560 [Nocardia terpenica]NQE93347.1 DUF3558 domain-containing protein [Nocardia terpenica]
MKVTDQRDPEEPLWDPRKITHDVWRRIGVDPATLSSNIAGFTHLHGFKRYGGHDTLRTYAVDVWSQVSTVGDFERGEARAEFVPVTIAGRQGLRYRPTSDRTGDQCHLIFPSPQGSYSITVTRLDSRSPVVPCDRVVEVAKIVVPWLPD